MTPQMKTEGIPGFFPKTPEHQESPVKLSPLSNRSQPDATDVLSLDRDSELLQEDMNSLSFDVDQQEISIEPIAHESIAFDADVSVINDTIQWPAEFDALPTANRRQRLLSDLK
jgi:hypothetical protein